MIHFLFIFFIISAITGAASILLYSLIYSKIRISLFRKYIYFLLLGVSVAISVMVRHYFILINATGIITEVIMMVIINIIMSFMIYYVPVFFHDLSESRLTKFHRAAFIIIAASSFFTSLVQLVIFNDTYKDRAINSGNVIAVQVLFCFSAALYCLSVITYRYGKIKSRIIKTIVRGFIAAGFPLSACMVFFIVSMFFSYDVINEWYFPFLMFCFFIVNSISIIFFYKHFNRMINFSSAFAAVPDSMINNFNITDREKNILLLLLEKKQYNEIGRILSISKKTVEVHVGNVYKKLSVKNREELVSLVDRYKNK